MRNWYGGGNVGFFFAGSLPYLSPVRPCLHRTITEWSEEVGTALSQIRPNGRYQCDKWLTAMWMVVNCKNGVSSWEIHRALGVTQKTAWFLDHRIRFMLGDEYETMQHNRKSSAIL
jgi:hypothetical protein